MIVAENINRTSIILAKGALNSLGLGVIQFEIEVVTGTDTHANEGDIVGRRIVQATPVDDLYYQSRDDVVFSGLVFGGYYWFRARTIDSQGQRSEWSSFVSEQAGDNTNASTISGASVVQKSTGVTFKVTATVPEDFHHFEWFVATQAAALTDTSAPAPALPTGTGYDDQTASYPATAAPASVMTTDPNSVQITLNESRLLWYYVWVKSIDRSGNGYPTSNHGWQYVGVGKVLALDAKTDGDDVPPDNTDKITSQQASDLLLPSWNWL